MHATRLAHAYVFANDVDRIARFYEGAFGLRRENTSDNGEGLSNALCVPRRCRSKKPMLTTTNVDPIRVDPIEDRSLRRLSVLGLSLAVITALVALALSMGANIG